MLKRLKAGLPVLIVLLALTALGYPLALVFGLPLARRDMQDLRKWEKTTYRVDAAEANQAQLLEGVVDGVNRSFTFKEGNLVENDRSRQVYVGQRLLSAQGERPEERVDGERQRFHFQQDDGFVVLDGVLQQAPEDYTRTANSILFVEPPQRNAQLRQYVDYLVEDASASKILLFEAPMPGSAVWTNHYTVYSRPACGNTVMACFFAMPQHPVPFPHWIFQRIIPFFNKYGLDDERNVLRALFYTTLGTLSALALGGVIGIVLAIIFVLIRPLERALLPWVVASQTVPIIALVPVLLLILGNFGITIQTSLLPTAIIGAYIAFFPVVVGTVKGLRSVDPLALDLMKTYAASPWQVFMKVRFPAAVPFFFTSMKLATAAALVGALVAETESNNRKGLGFQILGQVQSGNVADVWILLLLSGLLGVVLVALVGAIQRLVAPWEQQ